MIRSWHVENRLDELSILPKALNQVIGNYVGEYVAFADLKSWIKKLEPQFDKFREDVKPPNRNLDKFVYSFLYIFTEFEQFRQEELEKGLSQERKEEFKLRIEDGFTHRNPFVRAAEFVGSGYIIDPAAWLPKSKSMITKINVLDLLTHMKPYCSPSQYSCLQELVEGFISIQHDAFPFIKLSPLEMKYLDTYTMATSTSKKPYGFQEIKDSNQLKTGLDQLLLTDLIKVSKTQESIAMVIPANQVGHYGVYVKEAVMQAFAMKLLPLEAFHICSLSFLRLVAEPNSVDPAKYESEWSKKLAIRQKQLEKHIPSGGSLKIVGMDGFYFNGYRIWGTEGTVKHLQNRIKNKKNDNYNPYQEAISTLIVNITKELQSKCNEGNLQAPEILENWVSTINIRRLYPATDVESGLNFFIKLKEEWLSKINKNVKWLGGIIKEINKLESCFNEIKEELNSNKIVCSL